MLPVFLSLLAVFIAVGVVFFATAKKAGQQREADLRDRLTPESRSIFATTRKGAEEIREMVEGAANGSPTKIIGTEAVAEADRLSRQVVEALATRQELRRLRLKGNAVGLERQRLQQQHAVAKSDAERLALERAIETKQEEQAQYEEIDAEIARIDASVRTAEAAIGELRARLALAHSQDRAGGSQADELREAIARTKALSVSIDEAKGFLQDPLNERAT